MRFKNLADMFVANAERLKDRTAYMYKHEGEYKSLTYNQALTLMSKLAAGLRQLGVKRGENVAILSENRYEWALTDYAILSQSEPAGQSGSGAPELPITGKNNCI
jgi:long-chain acyl-CoA synthetase